MPDDHLSNEMAISAELTENGVKAAAKSRAVAAIDRLVGNVVDLGNAWTEGVTVRKRAKTEGERRLIEAAVQYGIERIGQDSEFAERAFRTHYRKIAAQQLNKDAVVQEALNDLRSQPPTDVQASAGPNEIAEDFMTRLENYAEGATSEELRQRWGRILASEIRKPGTFSTKVLRATDELDADTAKAFEALMPYRVADVLIRAVMEQDIDFGVMVNLVSAGLLVEPGLMGHSQLFGSASNKSGEELWISQFGELVIGFRKDAALVAKDGIITNYEAQPRMPVYILTDVGKALSSILPFNEENVGRQYGAKLRHQLPDGAMKVYAVLPDGSMRPALMPF